MRKAPLIVSAICVLYARILLGSPPTTPTPTPTPKPVHYGPTLAITFSGMTLFMKNANGYRVIVPAMRAHHHEPYIRFLVSDVSTDTFDAAPAFSCDGDDYQWAPLTADLLTIDPDRQIATTTLNNSGIDGWLVHLPDLAPGSQLNEDDYNNANPVVSKVAAQMTVDRGTLEPVVLDPPYEPVRWEFKDGNNPSPSETKICGTSGIRWLLPIKKDTREISLVSSLKKHPRLTLKLTNGHTTEVIIGNSVVDSAVNDIECPKSPPVPVDQHFKLYYKLLKAQVAKEYVPVRVTPAEKCPKTKGVNARKSQRGSDCIGAQWP